MSTDATLRTFCDSTGRAVGSVLARWTDDLAPGTIEIVPSGESPLADIPVPAVVAAAWYGDQSAGGNVLVLTTRGAKKLAAEIVGAQTSGDADDELITELELSALDEAMGHIMTAAAATASDLLGREIATGSPETHSVSDAQAAEEICAPSEHVSAYSFTVCGEDARLVQVVPAAFLAEAGRRLAETEASATSASEPAGDAPAASSEGAIRGVPVRVWAELERIRMPLARAVGLPPGVVVEFECGAEDPIDLFVNGRPFGTGRLLVGEGRWAIEVQEVFEHAQSAA